MTKILPIGALLVIAFFSPVRDTVSSFVQSLILDSGMVDASASVSKKSAFDYDFQMTDLAGNTIDFRDFKGKVVFLNLWATWCGPCRSEMPSIQKLYDEIDNTKVSFVMLSLDDQTQLRKVKAYVQRSGYTFPVYINNGRLTSQLEVPSIPTTFVIDKDGFINTREVGMKNYHTSKFKKYINQLVQ